MEYIIYHSNTGFTKEYAKLLGKELNLPVIEESKFKEKNKNIIYLGNIFADNIDKYKKNSKRNNCKVIIGVGISKVTKEKIVKVKEVNNITTNEGFFLLQGGFDRKNIKGISKIVIDIMSKELLRKQNKTEEEEILYNDFINGSCYVNKDNLKEIIEYIKRGC